MGGEPPGAGLGREVFVTGAEAVPGERSDTSTSAAVTTAAVVTTPAATHRARRARRLACSRRLASSRRSSARLRLTFLCDIRHSRERSDATLEARA